MSKMSMNTGRIKLPRGRTANERAKDRAAKSLNRCLVISYDSDEQQWFYDTVLAKDTADAEEYILNLRPYCIGADGSLPIDFQGDVSLKIKGTTFDTSDAICECQNCETCTPQSKLKPIRDINQRVEPGEAMPAGECPECGALCHIKFMSGGK